MRWTPSQDAKPDLYKVVVVRFKVRNGSIVEREGFWTGYHWRIIGDTYKLHFTVIEWAYSPEEHETAR